MEQRRLGFVPPRYGWDVVGGSEMAVRELAHGLSDRGWNVDVLTTCARDHFTWENCYPAGVSYDRGVRVLRFPAVVSTARRDRHEIGHAVFAGERVDLARQHRWMNDDVRVPELYHYLLDHSDEYDALIFSPYLFWPAYACSQIAPERSIIIPCLHDEPFAHLEIFEPMFRDTRGIWFLTEPERELGRRIHPGITDHEVVGTGVTVPARYDPEGFRRRHGIHGPFVLYAGRREEYGKNWGRLLRNFADAVRRSDLPLSLVTMGAGEVHAPPEIADRVIDLGFLPDEERDNAFAAADAYVQPSGFESFSRSMMEAMLAETLVIAYGGSEVNRWHCERSGAGLVYEDSYELEQCLRLVVEAPDVARAIARRGPAYVLDNYTWPRVLDRVEESLTRWIADPAYAATARSAAVGR